MFNISSNNKPKEVTKSQLGKRSRNKGSKFERDIAKKFESNYGVEMVRTPQSGGFAKNKTSAIGFRGDIVPANTDVDGTLHIECKNTKTWSLPAWLKQAEEDCPDGKIASVIFHKHGTSMDYITLSLDDFFKIVPKKSIFKDKYK